MSTFTTDIQSDISSTRDAFVERCFQSVVSSMTLLTMHVGDQLGFYRTLAERGSMNCAALARRAGTNERYTQEWLEQQVMSGILHVDDSTKPASSQIFSLPEAHREALADPDSLHYIAPLGQLAAGAMTPMEQLLDAFRTGQGVSYEAYGQHLREGQARMNRPMFLHQLGQEYLPAMPDVYERLQRKPPAKVADIGCGYGWSSIGLAKAFPLIEVHGFDLDEPSVESARRCAAEAGVENRVRFKARDGGDPALAGQYDLVTAFECVHDLSDPVAVLRTMRRLLRPGGAVLVMDERTAEHFGGEGNDIEAFLYSCSVLHCLPVGMAEQPSAATGTVMRPSTFRRYAEEAGFSKVEILPIHNFFFRFYRLHP